MDHGTKMWLTTMAISLVLLFISWLLSFIFYDSWEDGIDNNILIWAFLAMGLPFLIFDLIIIAPLLFVPYIVAKGLLQFGEKKS